MCTAVCYGDDTRFFGRTLDYDIFYDSRVVIIPRNFRLDFRSDDFLPTHYAICGMAMLMQGYPLFFDAMNEKGLCIAALNLSKSAQYFSPRADRHSVASFELIPWILSRCDSVPHATLALEDVLITDTQFCDGLEPSRLHWMMADTSGCAVIEQTADGISVYENEARVLTNEPTFKKQLANLERYRSLTPDSPEGDSRGLGAVGLPGDLSSQSRFVRAEFMNRNALCFENRQKSVNQFFHILDSVSQIKGCCSVDGKYEYTQYQSCMDISNRLYYYKGYDDNTPRSVDMYRKNLNGTKIITPEI